MTTNQYMVARRPWGRPQGMLWSDTPGTLVFIDPTDPGLGSVYVPSGVESYANFAGLTAAQTSDQFLILSDHNRAEINVSPQRIEQRQRMVNGTMRSHHIADKLTITTSWDMLPSRQASVRANWNVTTGISSVSNSDAYTADFGAGGAEILKWYEDHTGPFWVFLSYDKYINFGTDNAAHDHLTEYSQVVQMYISNFDYSVVKRGQSNFDMWNINVTLEEV
jgi:hypothetical protein